MKKILGIDLGKFKSEVCVYETGTAEVRFQPVATERMYLRRVLELERPDFVVFEACTPAGWVYDLCQEMGIVAKVANTTGEAWKWRNIKRKTDRDDALKLATLAAIGELTEVHMPWQQTRQRRALIKFRHGLVERRVAVQNHIRAVLAAQGLLAPRGQRAWTCEGIETVGRQAKPLSDCEPLELWRGQLHTALQEFDELCKRIATVERKLDELARNDSRTLLLESIDGVGRRTAEVVAVYVDQPQRFSNSRQVSAFGGLVPRQFQSGQMDRRGRITKRGPSLLRKALVEASWCMLRYNPWARSVVQRLSRGQKTRKKQAIVALARKLLVRCWAMLRDGTQWRGSPELPTP